MVLILSCLYWAMLFEFFNLKKNIGFKGKVFGMCSQKNNFHYFFAESTWNDCNVAIAMTQATIYGLNKGWLQVFCYRLDFFFCGATLRSIHRRCSVRKGVLGNFARFTGKHLCQSVFLNQVAGLRPAISLKKRLWHRCFPMNFAKFLKTLFLQNTSGRLLLYSIENLSTKSYSVNKWR